MEEERKDPGWGLPIVLGFGSAVVGNQVFDLDGWLLVAFMLVVFIIVRKIGHYR